MDENMMIPAQETALTPETAQVVTAMVREIITPVMESIGKLLMHNTEAMEQIAAAQQATSERMAALERKVRLQTPMSRTQEKYINDAIKARAKELLDGKGISDDRRAISKLSALIRKSVLTRYGVSSLREAPAYDYETALKQINTWNNILLVRDTAKEARMRSEEKADENS